MDQNLVIGAGIAIISSSIGAALTYYFQTLDANKKRRWELDDKVTEKTQKSLLDRINLIESLILDIYNCANKTIDQVGQFAGELNKLVEVNAVLTNLMIKQKTINNKHSILST